MVFVPLAVGGAFLLLVMLYHNWMHVDDDPSRYIEDLKDPRGASWRSASRLAAMLRDPDHEHLTRDRQLAAELSELLEQRVASGGASAADVKMQVFLCRALGEFTVDDGLATLIHVASSNADGVDIEVRCAALEAIAALAAAFSPNDVRSNKNLTLAVVAASRAESTADGDRQRARAAYCLGVIGSPNAVDRLAEMLADPHPNARFNAATGLARNGDVRSVGVLMEMLDANSKTVVAGETEDAGRIWKRRQVQLNALAAVQQLHEAQPRADLTAVTATVEDLLADKASDAVAKSARATLAALRQRD
jgi:HEAT repeat protein